MIDKVIRSLSEFEMELITDQNFGCASGYKTANSE